MGLNATALSRKQPRPRRRNRRHSGNRPKREVQKTPLSLSAASPSKPASTPPPWAVPDFPVHRDSQSGICHIWLPHPGDAERATQQIRALFRQVEAAQGLILGLDTIRMEGTQQVVGWQLRYMERRSLSVSRAA